MSKILRYEVVYANSEQAFNEQINTMIREGWQPFGGISVSFQHNGQFQQTIYHQAMVEYSQEKLLLASAGTSNAESAKHHLHHLL